MSYEKAIESYNRIYEKVDLPAIQKLWNANQGDLNVYVHSPFCASICRFCYYKGVEFSSEKDSPLYERFYSEYLPSTIEPFRPMLESRRIGNYFFGGGTPSLMRPETMRSVFQLLPGLREVRSKTFEIHPAIWSEAQLDVLAEHGFNCCIIGVQSFDEQVLKRQRRIHAPFERVLELAEGIRSRGMHVAADLIYRMDEIDADEIFERDLERMEQLGSDVISLQLNYDEMHEEAHNERFFELIFGSDLASGYYWEGGREISINQKKNLKCFRYVKNEIPVRRYALELFPFTNTLDEASKVVGEDEHLPSVIGFGSYRNPRKNTFSNIRDAKQTVEYIEVNNDWKPEYFITYQSGARDFFAECVKELEAFRSIGPPPTGLRLVFENMVPRTREDYIYRKVDSGVGVSVAWDYINPEIEAYIAKLKELFPHWNWGQSGG